MNEKIKKLLQKLFLVKRDDNFYNERIKRNSEILRNKIIKDTNWLGVTTHRGGEAQGLAFHEQAIKYYEYKNMVIQRRSQYVIIFLTIVLLLMTGFQIYFTFFGKN